ncbi:YfjD family protein [Bacillus sp. CMF21]|nr:YfjD family protein [Bacillus sp. CMF21]
MLNLKKENQLIKVKGSKFMYGWMLLATFGALAASVFLILNGFKFESKYSLIYISGGFVFLPVFLYLTLWSLPGFIPGKILFILKEGVNGSVITKKRKILFNEILNLAFVRNPVNLINDIIIESIDGKITKICTYNLIDDTDFAVLVDKYVYPNMREDAKAVWDRQVNLSELYQHAKYERKTDI